MSHEPLTILLFMLTQTFAATTSSPSLMPGKEWVTESAEAVNADHLYRHNRSSRAVFSLRSEISRTKDAETYVKNWFSVYPRLGFTLKREAAGKTAEGLPLLVYRLTSVEQGVEMLQFVTVENKTAVVMNCAGPIGDLKIVETDCRHLAESLKLPAEKSLKKR